MVHAPHGLANTGHRGSQVVLKGVRRNTEEDVDQAVISHPRQQCLLIAESIGSDDLGCSVRNLALVF
jgi:hypothetical protein